MELQTTWPQRWIHVFACAPDRQPRSIRSGVFHLLSTRYTSDELISNLGVDSMSDTENSHDDITEMDSELTTRNSRGRVFVLLTVARQTISNGMIVFRLTALASEANDRVSPTVKAGKLEDKAVSVSSQNHTKMTYWISCSAVYRASPLKFECICFASIPGEHEVTRFSAGQNTMDI